MEVWKNGSMEVSELINQYFHTSILPYLFVNVLNIKTKVHNIPVLHDIVLSFNPEFAGFAAGCF